MCWLGPTPVKLLVRPPVKLNPMFENELETLASGIGSLTIVVRRANIRFAPTLVSDIGWISITTIYPKIYDRLLRSPSLCIPRQRLEKSAKHWNVSIIIRYCELIECIIPIASIKSTLSFSFMSKISLPCGCHISQSTCL